MTLDQFLERFIEGYLFEDLRSMEPIKKQPYGEMGYPMVMAVASGIEVLGVLTSRVTSGKGSGRARFGEFWRDYLYPHDPDLQQLGPTVYEFVRHGLAHAYITKPVVEVTKEKNPAHLHRDDRNVLVLDALTLWKDFETAYVERLRPKIQGAFKKNMETRFREFRDLYKEEREKHKELFDRVPLLSRQPVANQANAPTVSMSYSTNVSSRGFGSGND